MSIGIKVNVDAKQNQCFPNICLIDNNLDNFGETLEMKSDTKKFLGKLVLSKSRIKRE